MPDAPRDGDKDGRVYDGTPREQTLQLRDFDDPGAIRTGIYDKVLDAAKTIPGVSNSRHALELHDIGYEGPENFTLADEKKAVLEGHSLGRRLRGTLILKDVTGRELDRKRTTLAVVPHYTPRGTFINGGNEYTLIHQLRLRPGIYHRIKDSGELESHVNVLPRQGLSHRIFMQPETGQFKIKVGQAEMPIVPLLRAFGATDSQLREAWGNGIAHANMQKADASVITKLYDRLVRSKGEPPDEEGRRAAVAEAFRKMPLDAEVNRHTLGHPYDHVNLDVMLASTKKLIAINRGEAQPDDRDHLAFMTVHGPEDLLAERLGMDRTTLRNALWKAGRSDSLQHIQPGMFTKPIQAAILSSGLGSPGENINAMSVLDQRHRITRMGAGGIPSVDSIPESSRAVQPSHFAFIDSIITPESLRAGVDSRVATGVKKGSDGRLYAKFRDVRNNQMVFRSPQDLADKVLAFPGELDSGEPLVSVLKHGRIRTVPRREVDYELPAMESSYSPTTNLIPLKSMSKPQRVGMGARITTQALPGGRDGIAEGAEDLASAVPIIDGEAPLVQSGVPGTNESYEQRFGEHAGAIRSKHHGAVAAVDNGTIKLLTRDGRQVVHQLHVSHPSNRKTETHQVPTVRPGDPVSPGSLLARSNYTDANGTLALGKNARVVYVPTGHNFEDAVHVSESFAKRMSSSHMYQHHLELGEGIRTGKHAHVALFPGKYDRKLLENYDEDGVVKPGTTVTHNQPLILAAKKRDRTYGSLNTGRSSAYSDHSELWDHHTPGVVTDVAKTPKGTLVTVRSHMPLQVADKLCYSADTDVLTVDGWKSITDVTTADRVASLGVDDRIEYLHPVATQQFHHTGRMYSLETTQVSLCVTDNHNLYANVQRASRYKDGYQLVQAKDLFGKTFRLQRNGQWHGTSPRYVVLPAVVVPAGQFGRGTRTIPAVYVPVKTYLMILGMFLSEGSTFDIGGGGRGFAISQIKQPNRNQLHTALTKAGIKHCMDRHGARIYSLQWYLHLEGLGLSWQKFIPPDIFDWASGDLQILYQWLMWGDGHTGSTSHHYYTSSALLADDVQKLTLHLGMSANIDNAPPRRDTIKGKEYNCRQRFMVSIFRHKNRPEVNHTHAKKQNGQSETWIDWDDNVFCVTLPRNHVLYVRRKGKPVWCGNSGQHGNKGVVAKIAPDHEMPHDAQGIPYDLAFNPLGTISRTNSSQHIAGALGKIAAQTGKPYIVHDFDKGRVPDWTAFAQQELARHGLRPDSTEPVIDPIRGRRIVDPFTGGDPQTANLFIMKLHHTSESKGQGRGVGGYTSEGTPAKGGEHGSKKLALMNLNALLSYGATETIRDAGMLRGQAQPELWAQFMSGHNPPMPKVPHTNQKFFNLLTAAGINPHRDGTRVQLMALTDKDVDELAGDRNLENADTVDWKNNLVPVKGGLFDESLTGGGDGGRWSAIPLAEPMPSPVMEEPIRRTLGLTVKQFRDVLAGKEKLNETTGPAAISSALSSINLPKAIEQARQDIRAGNGTKRDAAVRRLRYLEGAQRLGLHPKDWVLSRVPVLPPAFRPVSLMQGTHQPMISDPNLVYQELHAANQNLKAVSGKIDDPGEERLALYDAFKAVTGLGEPASPKLREKQVGGILKPVFSSSPKYGIVQRKLLGSTTDLVGRAVITPDPDLDMDQVGLPENRAWDVYQPFVVRRLVRNGMPRMRAMRAVRDRTDQARAALQDEVQSRPVIIDRAPVLHRYGVMAAWPRLTKGEALRIPPLIVKGAGADFDGDMMNYHVPASDEAVQEAIDKLLPSKNLISPADFKGSVFLPGQEYSGGLFTASAAKDTSRPPKTFATRADALRAYNRGELSVADQVSILSPSS